EISAFSSLGLRPAGDNNPTLAYPSIDNRYTPFLGWEKMRMANVGIDFGMRNGLHGSIDLYRKTGKDLLGRPASDSAIGVNSIKGDAASLVGHGIDMVLGYQYRFSSSLACQSLLLFGYATEKVVH